MALQPLFGANVDPSVDQLAESYGRAQAADAGGLDLISIQDHPYNRRHLDTLTLMTTLAARTQHARFITDVANLPLRPPAMLAKQIATLDVISGGRVELGLGAGGFWDAIKAYGGPKRTPGQAYRAFDEALQILRGMWDSGGHSFSFQGEFYQVNGAQPGPIPAHRIPIWVGANGPKMMYLTGRRADGILVSSAYVPTARLLEINRQIDAGALEAGRSPDAIRRGYNVMGIIDLGRYGRRPDGLNDSVIFGTPAQWVEQLTRLYLDYRVDTFLVWPFGEDGVAQIEVFARDIASAVRAAVSG